MAVMTACSMNNGSMMSYGHHFSYANNASLDLSVGVIRITSVFCDFGIISVLVKRIIRFLYNTIQVLGYDSA